MTPEDRAALDALRARVTKLFESSEEQLHSLDISRAAPGLWQIRTEIRVGDRPAFTVDGSGATSEAAFVSWLDRLMTAVGNIDELMRRGFAKCWVCGSERERTAMEAGLVGGTIWWLCERCQTRRANAARLNLTWPTDYDAWLRRWKAEQRTAGRDDAWIAAVEAEARESYDSDPTLVNRHAALLRAAESL